MPLFKAVDMVDVTEDFLTKARTYLGEEGRRVRNYFCCGLQDFSPEPNSYDVIWIQWVIGERTPPSAIWKRPLQFCCPQPTSVPLYGGYTLAGVGFTQGGQVEQLALLH